MASVRSRKLHSTCKHPFCKCGSCDTNDPTLDTSKLSIRIDDMNSHRNSFEHTSSPSSNASTIMTEQSSKFGHQILSSTLKSNFLRYIFSSENIRLRFCLQKSKIIFPIYQ